MFDTSSSRACDRPDLHVLRQALHAVIDPEIGIGIVELGLIYRLEYVGSALEVDLTLTSPACPAGEMLGADVEQALQAQLPADVPVVLRMTFDPPWEPARISADCRRRLGW